ncbi:MAG: hypothetical protein ACYCPQ_09135 [Elusimicrobiota bacterium]
MKRFKTILCALILCAASGGAWAQTNSDVARFRAIHRQRADADLAKWQPMLDQYHAGKLDDHDAAAVLYHALTDYGLMQSTGTAEVAELAKEYQALLKKHPDYVNRRFMRTHAQETVEKASRKKMREHYQQMAETRKTWVPLDKTCFCYVYKNDMVAMHSYRIEFFHVESNEPKLANGCVKVTASPHKIITFRNAIRVEPSWLGFKGQPIVVCTDPTEDYGAEDQAERDAIGRQGLFWHNPKAEFDNFCGVIGLDGTIIAQIPGEWKLPTYTRPLGILPDGSEALFGIGHEGLMPVDPKKDWNRESVAPGFNYRYLILWQRPNKIQRIDIQTLNEKHFNDLRKEFGIGMEMMDLSSYQHALK